MNLFRGKFTRRIITLLAGITFLNMSFILAEVAALGLSKNTILIQNILNAGIEEENGCDGESNEKK